MAKHRFPLLQPIRMCALFLFLQSANLKVNLYFDYGATLFSVDETDQDVCVILISSVLYGNSLSLSLTRVSDHVNPRYMPLGSAIFSGQHETFLNSAHHKQVAPCSNL